MSPVDQSYRPSVLVDPEPSPVDRYLVEEMTLPDRVAGVMEWRARNRVPAVFRRAFAETEEV
jgi:hypothetical protein